MNGNTGAIKIGDVFIPLSEANKLPFYRISDSIEFSARPGHLEIKPDLQDGIPKLRGLFDEAKVTNHRTDQQVASIDVPFEPHMGALSGNDDALFLRWVVKDGPQVALAIRLADQRFSVIIGKNIWPAQNQIREFDPKFLRVTAELGNGQRTGTIVEATRQDGTVMQHHYDLLGNWTHSEELKDSNYWLWIVGGISISVSGLIAAVFALAKKIFSSLNAIDGKTAIKNQQVSYEATQEAAIAAGPARTSLGAARIGNDRSLALIKRSFLFSHSSRRFHSDGNAPP